MLPTTFSCPRCKCHALYRTHRKGLDWLVSAFGLRPVRCMTCDKRFYLRHARIKNYDPYPPKRTYVHEGSDTRTHGESGRVA